MTVLAHTRLGDERDIAPGKTGRYLYLLANDSTWLADLHRQRTPLGDYGVYVDSRNTSRPGFPDRFWPSFDAAAAEIDVFCGEVLEAQK